MRFNQNGGTDVFDVGFCSAAMSKGNKFVTWILRVAPMGPSTLYSLAINEAIFDSLSGGICLLLDTSINEGYNLVVPEFVACGNARRSSSI